jgi:ATP-dependent helicase HrpB
MISLPVDALIPQIVQAIDQSPIVIVDAPPGSGKTTRVAPALIERFAKDNRRIVLLQPRRIAVQTVASRIADEVGCRVGQQVGYAIRFDSKFNRDTQLLIATEGILTRMIVDDIALSDISVVIFDEFHERSLDSDLLLAMCRHIQSTIRPDLRIVIMSATIASSSLSSLLSNVPVIRTDGRMFPVDIRYAPTNIADKLSHSTASLVKQAVAKHNGDVLVFLPGKGEIFQTQSLLESMIGKDCEVLPLFGAMKMEEQAYVVGANRNADRRRVILSTNIAETSLTIEGIRIVIDSGLARVMRYDPASGLDRLMLEPICRASSDQRAGRAGRVAAGVAYRMWSEASQRARPEYLEPEIHRVDFAAALLMLYSLNEPSIDRLPWLDAPRTETVAAAERLLEQLDAIEDRAITSVGMLMMHIPLHPRLSRLVLEGSRLNIAKESAMAAALLSEREPFIQQFANSKTSSRNNVPLRRDQSAASQPRRWPCDVSEQLEVIEDYRSTGRSMTKFGEVHRNTLQTIDRVANQVLDCISELNHKPTNQASDVADRWIRLRQAILSAFPDRLAKRRGRGQDRGVMVAGKGVKIGPESGVVLLDFFVCLDAEASTSDAKVRIASGIDRDWLSGDNIRVADELFYSPTHKAVQCRRRTYWIDLLLEESPAAITDRKAAGKILAQTALADWKRFFPADDADLANAIGRINLLAANYPELNIKAIDQQRLKDICESICYQVTSLDELKSANWLSYVMGSLSAGASASLHRLLPAKIATKSGRQFAIDYSGDQPKLSIKIQDAFGMMTNPKVCDGRIIVQLHLLAPNMRTQQITNDLASFWKTGYVTVKKELKRRYPKHAWPDDPLQPIS